MDGCMNNCVYVWIYKWMDEWMDVLMDLCTYGQLDGQTLWMNNNGWMDGFIY